MSGSDTFRISLTPEQKEQVRKATGKEANTIELTVEELEERIAPMTPEAEATPSENSRNFHGSREDCAIVSPH